MGRVMGQFTSMNSDQMQSIQGNNPGEPGFCRIAGLSELQIAIACSHMSMVISSNTATYCHLDQGSSRFLQPLHLPWLQEPGHPDDA